MGAGNDGCRGKEYENPWDVLERERAYLRVPADEQPSLGGIDLVTRERVNLDLLLVNPSISNTPHPAHQRI